MRRLERGQFGDESGFQGLPGNITCTPDGDCADPKIAVYEIPQENIANGEVPPAKIFPE